MVTESKLCVCLQITLDRKVLVQTLAALNDARITYPGKSEKAAEYILDKVRSSRYLGEGSAFKSL